MFTRPLILVGLVLVVIVAAVVLYGESHWQSGTKDLLDRLEADKVPIAAVVFSERELDDVPPPVARYFRAVLTDGQSLVAAVNLKHTGTFNMGETAERWRTFTSTQRVVIRRPGFVWDASIRMLPGLSVHVHDAYVAGEGILHAAVFGLASVVNLRGTRDMAEGELMRFLAEAAWYPTALLPGRGVQWEAMDDRSARATLQDGDVTVALTFHFGADDLIDAVRAVARGRTVDGVVVPTPWEGRFWNYAVRDGMRIPLDGEVAWVLPEGTKPYWGGHIVESSHEFVQP